MKNRMAFRLKEELWEDVIEICQREGITKTDFIVRAIEHEVRSNQREHSVTEALEANLAGEQSWQAIKDITSRAMKYAEEKGYH